MGHEYTVNNTRLYRGSRYCKECHKLRERRRRGKTEGVIAHQDRYECQRGHRYEDNNWIIYADGRRRCRACVNMRARSHTAKRRAIHNEVNYNYSSCDERFTRLLFDDSCFKCDSKNRLQIDHHYPLSRGFELSIDNAVLLCKSCNCRKNDLMPEEFYTARELDLIEYLFGLSVL